MPIDNGNAAVGSGIAVTRKVKEIGHRAAVGEPADQSEIANIVLVDDALRVAARVHLIGQRRVSDDEHVERFERLQSELEAAGF